MRAPRRQADVCSQLAPAQDAGVRPAQAEACREHTSPPGARPRTGATRVIFLDFDGVLNSWRYVREEQEAGRRVQLHNPDHVLDRAAVRVLNRIVRRSGARVVISSTWRFLHPLPKLRAMLRAAGFRGAVIDSTPVRHVERCHEIREWLDAHPEVTTYVAIDDDVDAHIEGHFVRTHFDAGLTAAHVPAALAALEGA